MSTDDRLLSELILSAFREALAKRNFVVAELLLQAIEQLGANYGHHTLVAEAYSALANASRRAGSPNSNKERSGRRS